MVQGMGSLCMWQVESHRCARREVLIAGAEARIACWICIAKRTRSLSYRFKYEYTQQTDNKPILGNQRSYVVSMRPIFELLFGESWRTDDKDDLEDTLNVLYDQNLPRVVFLFAGKPWLSFLHSRKLLLRFLLCTIHRFLLGGYSTLSQNFLRVSGANTTSLAIVEPLSNSDRGQVVRRHSLYESCAEETSNNYQTCLGHRHLRNLVVVSR
jgi:hypothetical protein